MGAGVFNLSVFLSLSLSLARSLALLRPACSHHLYSHAGGLGPSNTVTINGVTIQFYRCTYYYHIFLFSYRIIPKQEIFIFSLFPSFSVPSTSMLSLVCLFCFCVCVCFCFCFCFCFLFLFFVFVFVFVS